MIDTYRTPTAMVKIESKAKNATGLAIAKKPHRCAIPGFWTRLYYWLTFRKIHSWSCFRCPECLKIYEYINNEDWRKTSEEEWYRVHGELDLWEDEKNQK